MLIDLYEYFAANWNREPYPVIDHSLRIDRKPDGSFHFYIHPSNTSGITTDFTLTADKLELEDFGFHGIGWAIKQMHNGAKVARSGWNGKGMWLALQVPDAHSNMSLPYIYMKTADNKLVPWLASQTDLLANDWVVVE